MRAVRPTSPGGSLAFVLGLSNRKVGETLLAILGRPISAETLSEVA